MWNQLQNMFSNEENSRLDNLDETFTSFCRTPLHIAAMSGDVNIASKILSMVPEGLDLSLKQDSNGFTPLHLASVRTSIPMVRLLMEAKPDACIVQDGDGRTPLHLAAMKNQVEIMKLLMEGLPAAIHLRNHQNGETILHFCVKNNTNLKTLKLLVKKLVHAPLPEQNPNPISINSTNNDDNTILHLAAEIGNMEITNYLLLNSYVRIDINIVNKRRLKALDILSESEQSDLKFGFYGYHVRHHQHKSQTLSKNSDHKGLKDRVNALMVVATLIAGIAFQAAMNPPGGVWQDDSIVHSGTDPITFAYYVDHMYSTSISGGLDMYIQDNLPYYDINTIHRNGKKGRSHYNTTQFVKDLRNLQNYYSEETDYGLILEDFVFTEVVSYYNSTGNSSNGIFFPYLIRFAGSPILAYIWPDYYMAYMVTNGVAFFASLTIIFLVICGFMIETSVTQVRILVVLMCISIGCISFSYFSILVAMIPDFLGAVRVYLVLQLFLGVCCVLGVLWFIISTAWKIVKLRKRTRNHHIGVINYLKTLFFSMDAKAVGKLILFIAAYSAFRYTGCLYDGCWFNFIPFLY
ncbi:hypothetical protein C5167_021459 [Papaver somniferum]|uniref:uncharacterized protein LOC113345837 n=1 Tax=Papaver somniferum TaxID=3469 RepID=UPI000E6F4CD8|nr:uncharacterized protein LOC113345837 [Papaver somniferum]RZC94214.1 hypothetical protein C5167_021459 [Papaver somniferum]